MSKNAILLLQIRWCMCLKGSWEYMKIKNTWQTKNILHVNRGFFCFPSPLRWYLYALYVKDYYCNIAISYEMFSYHLYNRVIGSIPPSFQHLWIPLRLFHLNPGKWITITTGNRICQNKFDIWPIMLHLIPKLGKNWMIFPRKTKNI